MEAQNRHYSQTQLTSQIYSFYTGKLLLRGGSPFLNKKENNDTNIFVSESSFLNILKGMVQCPEGFYIRVPWREWIFHRMYAFQTNKQTNTMFPWRAQNILQQCDLYGSLTFLTFVSEKLPGYILFFCKMWITYVGKMKNSVIIFCVLLSFGYYLLVSLHLFFTLPQNSSKDQAHVRSFKLEKAELLQRTVC